MEDREKLAWEVWNWQHGKATNFTCELFSLFCKADVNNRRKLADAFPEEASIFGEWYFSPTPEEFYARHGVGIGSAQ